MRNLKIYFEGLGGNSGNFAPVKISCYTVPLLENCMVVGM